MKKFLYILLGILIFIFIVLMYSRFIGTTSLKVIEKTINTNINESFNGLKIVHFSDIHFKKIITEERVSDVIENINNTYPDLIIFTGDLLDSMYETTNSDVSFLIEMLSKLESKYGKYAVMGDNDYKDREIINNIYIQSEFLLLNNNSTIIYSKNNDKINLVGLGSNISKDFNIDNTNIDTNNYTIILMHEPDMIDKVLEKYPNTSLILSGHSINGSINIPLLKKGLLPDGAKKYYKPYYKINNTDIYISNGIGVNNINFRLFNSPSFNLYRLKRS